MFDILEALYPNISENISLIIYVTVNSRLSAVSVVFTGRNVLGSMPDACSTHPVMPTSVKTV
jgi:hypothetical protein